ncbi:GNAT family N-acetyltransferase [Paraferrimonas sp. SM1919]|uniref:GNAT family N-acetyltransferase n=1 Tax=Paraferrimonas sp. SM1919 TaxID=2662263 RepID=UPI0013D1D543|nr:GNAT family N-acetyltransferase [Paraferrimonas sp. SM1919]
MCIRAATKADYDELIELWERSVRATHDFLPNQLISELKVSLRNQYLAAVQLFCVQKRGEDIMGFVGVTDGNIEMLFVHPNYFRKGVGQLLVEFATRKLKASSVDVNEQNPQALAFYLALGFVQTGRSEVDAQGNPFPLLHLSLAV